jgi:hypothetical protein
MVKSITAHSKSEQAKNQTSSTHLHGSGFGVAVIMHSAGRGITAAMNQRTE